MRRKKTQGSDTAAGGRITPAEVQQVEFRLAFRGYNERDVDAFLDRITEDLSAYIEENQRLRMEASAASPAAPPAPDPSAARAEAERIVAGAREEAARIIRDAEARAGVVAAAAGGDPRAAVAPFLSSEREFLQSLGSLVQGHAEDVKRMVAEMRSTAEISAPASAASPAPQDEPGPDAGADAGPGAKAERPAEPEPAERDSAPTEPEPTTAEETFAPISVPAAEGEPDVPVPEPAPVQLRRDSGDRSLRELFWGED